MAPPKIKTQTIKQTTITFHGSDLKRALRVAGYLVPLTAKCTVGNFEIDDETHLRVCWSENLDGNLGE
jgi:hypothetical protein